MEAKDEQLMNDQLDLIPASLYAGVSSDRHDVGLSVAAQLRALRDYAENNDYMVVREYVDEGESGRVADRPQFQKMLDEAESPRPIKGDIGLEVQPVHPEAGARRRFQVQAQAQGHPSGVHYRADRGQRDRQAPGSHHRVC